ncbi:MAG TPA: hypothetical protein VHB02_06570 [Acidimicrobiales bacterium]|nr:hypothetical protein [Acidimicrobiales bacterium]
MLAAPELLADHQEGVRALERGDGLDRAALARKLRKAGRLPATGG